MATTQNERIVTLRKLGACLDHGRDAEAISHVRVETCTDGYFVTGLYIGDAMDEDDMQADDEAAAYCVGIIPGTTNAFGPARVKAQKIADVLGLPYCE